MQDIESLLLKTLDGGSNSLVAIAVGTAEGTRAPDGAFIKAWWGHLNLGNGANNQGSFSYQGPALNPREADLAQIAKIRKILIPHFLRRFKSSALPPERLMEIWLLAVDVFVQSEVACLDRKGFLDLVVIVSDGQVEDYINCRVNAYFDPKSGKLDAPGFGNSLSRLADDQRRRTEAVLSVLEKQGAIA